MRANCLQGRCLTRVIGKAKEEHRKSYKDIYREIEREREREGIKMVTKGVSVS